MNWLNKIADDVEVRVPQGEITIESGISPSGNYHMGYLREILTCDAIKWALQQRGRQARHIHFVDDLDGFRKVPAGLPTEYEEYLGKPLCDIPAPDGSGQTYADYALQSFLDSLAKLHVEVDVERSHQKYRAGFFVEAIEKTLENIDEVRSILEEVSGRQLEKDWAPIQVNEDGYLKNRRFVSIDKSVKTIIYLDAEDQEHTTSYAKGEVKLNWRLDWPARWWLVGVDVEPFGRDHGTKGGSYDTGVALMDKVFHAPAPIPVPYNFINRAGETKKLSASTGTGILMSEVVAVLPPEVARYFIFRSPPSKQLFFDPEGGVVRLIDEYAELLDKPRKSEEEKQLIALSQHGIEPTVSSIPFSHLVASYQTALSNPEQTLEILARTGYKDVVEQSHQLLTNQLKFIDQWLRRWAPEEVKFGVSEKVSAEAKQSLTQAQTNFLASLADKVSDAPSDADGDWYHKAIYDFKDSDGLAPKDLFAAIYTVLINKDYGPRAGWFLRDLAQLRGNDWLVKRLRLEA